MNLKLSIDAAIVAGRDDGGVADRGGKPDDPPGERAHRQRALDDVQAALAVESRARALALAATARRVEAATWLGSSLADLAAITGHSRQAARKRWPSQGRLARRRRWLGHHVEEVLWAARLVRDAGAALVDAGARTEDLDALVHDLAGVQRAFDAAGDPDPTARPTDDPDHPGAAVQRWVRLDHLVDEDLRAVLGAVAREPADPDAAFAHHAAGGVLGYYDHAVGEVPDDPDEG